MARKLARKVLNFELAMIKVPLSVFEDTVGDRLPPDSRLRRAVKRAAETIDVVAEATRSDGVKRPVRMAEPSAAKRPDRTPSAASAAAPTAKKAARKPTKKPAGKAAQSAAQPAARTTTKKAAQKAAKKTAN